PSFTYNRDNAMAADQNSSDATTGPEEADTIELWISPEDRLLLEHAARESLDPVPAISEAPARKPDALSSSADVILQSVGVPSAPALRAAVRRSSRLARLGSVGKWTRTRAAWQKLRQKPRGVSTAIDLAIVVTLIGLAYLVQYQLASPAGAPPLARR